MRTHLTNKETSLNKWKSYHFFLMFTILAFLLLIALLLYNELVNEKKLIENHRSILQNESLLNNIDSARYNIVKSQENLLNYLILNKDDNIEDYFLHLNKLKSIIDTAYNKEIKQTYTALPKSEDVKILNTIYNKIDSIKANIFENRYKIKKNIESLTYDNLHIKTTIETKSQVDSVEKKGLMRRLGDAVKGKVDVQKEKSDYIIVIEYGNDMTTGDIDEQLEEFLNRISKYHKEEKDQIYSNLAKTSDKNLDLLRFNETLQKKSKLLVDQYEKYLSEQKKILENKYDLQYSKNRSIRFYTILGLVLVLIIITIIAIYIVKLNYNYDKKLIYAKAISDQNVVLKNKIVSMISHDIRSPLQIILINIKHLLDIEKDPNKQNIFQSIFYSTNLASSIASKVLDYSKKGSFEIKNSSFILYQEINKLLEAYEILAKSKNNKLINANNIPENLHVIFDLQKLQRLYINLLDNAIRNTEKGIIEVVSNIKETETGKYKVNISVKDTGKGISIENMEKIIKGFAHTQSMTDEEDVNIIDGLGLYLCTEILNLFEGDITLNSKINEGTEVQIYFMICK